MDKIKIEKGTSTEEQVNWYLFTFVLFFVNLFILNKILFS
jgi:hypothetical protein